MSVFEPHSPSLPTGSIPEGPASSFVQGLLDPWHDDLAVRRHHTGRVTEPGFTTVPFRVTDGVEEVWRSGEVSDYLSTVALG